MSHSLPCDQNQGSQNPNLGSWSRIIIKDQGQGSGSKIKVKDKYQDSRTQINMKTLPQGFSPACETLKNIYFLGLKLTLEIKMSSCYFCIKRIGKGNMIQLSHICVSVEGWLEIYIIDQVDSNFTKPLGLIKDISDKKHIGHDYPVLERVQFLIT